MQSSLSKRQTREPQAITSPNYFQVTPPNVVLLLPRQVVAAAAAAAVEELESCRRSRRDFHIWLLKKPGGKSQEEKTFSPSLLFSFGCFLSLTQIHLFFYDIPKLSLFPCSTIFIYLTSFYFSFFPFFLFFSLFKGNSDLYLLLLFSSLSIYISLSFSVSGFFLLRQTRCPTKVLFLFLSFCFYVSNGWFLISGNGFPRRLVSPTSVFSPSSSNSCHHKYQNENAPVFLFLSLLPDFWINENILTLW